jgi:hypothetical protein
MGILRRSVALRSSDRRSLLRHGVRTASPCTAIRQATRLRKRLCVWAEMLPLCPELVRRLLCCLKSRLRRKVQRLMRCSEAPLEIAASLPKSPG